MATENKFTNNYDCENKIELNEVIFIVFNNNIYCYTQDEMKSILNIYCTPRLPIINVYVDSSLKKLFYKGANTYRLIEGKGNILRSSALDAKMEEGIIYSAVEIDRCSIREFQDCNKNMFRNNDKFQYEYFFPKDKFLFKKKIIQKYNLSKEFEMLKGELNDYYQREIYANPNIYNINSEEYLSNFVINPNFTWDNIKTNSNLPHGIWSQLSKNINITWDIVRDNSDKPWDFWNLSQNPNITWEIVRNNKTFPDGREIYWNYDTLAYHPNITWDIVINNPILPNGKTWSYGYLSLNPNITWDNVKSNFHKYWDYENLTRHPNITFDIIKNNLFFPKEGQIINNLNGKPIPWNFDILSLNQNITWDIVINNPILPNGKTWNYEYLSGNFNITEKIIRENNDKPWNLYVMIVNPNLSLKFLMEEMKISKNDLNFYVRNIRYYNDYVFKNKFYNYNLLNLAKISNRQTGIFPTLNNNEMMNQLGDSNVFDIISEFT